VPARDGGYDWVEDRFYKGKKIERVCIGWLGRVIVIRLAD